MTDKAFVPDDPTFDTSLISAHFSTADVQASIEHLPSGFRALALTDRLRRPLLELLCKICTDAGTIRLSPNEASRLYNSFREAAYGSLDESIYFALLVYFLNVYGRSRCCVTYLRTLQKLADAVARLRPSDRAESDCLIWILTVAEAGSVGTHWEDQVPFMEHMLLLLPESRDRAGWRSALRRFFWNDALGTEWEEAWTNAMQTATRAGSEETEMDGVETVSWGELSQPASQRRMCCQSPTLPEVGYGMPAVWH